MKENCELLEHIYKDSEMASYTLTKLIRDLKDKDNKKRSRRYTKRVWRMEQKNSKIFKERKSWNKRCQYYGKNDG